MPLIEGFRIQNYRALRDITLGKLATDKKGNPLTPFTVVIGKNGSAKAIEFALALAFFFTYPVRF